MNIYQNITDAVANGQKLLAILLDPDKISPQRETLLAKINQSPATHILIGGSHVNNADINGLVQYVKSRTALPVILFPGDPSQISPYADGILFLSLLSGRNADFLIGHHVQAAGALKASNLEIIPTAYLLIESGRSTAVARVSRTQPMDRNNIDAIVATAVAGQMLGHRLIYLEAGSGADCAVPQNVIENVAANVDVPLIVGGGIRSMSAIKEAYAAGADMVVIGTAFENDLHFFD